ncbi:MAG: tetratricopeptide repeat protein [Bdellovibrionota bacterium]
MKSHLLYRTSVGTLLALYLTPPLWAQSPAYSVNELRSERLTPIGEKAREGKFQSRSFDAFDVPTYQMDQVFIEKSRNEIDLLNSLVDKANSNEQKANILFRLAELNWGVEKTSYTQQVEVYDREMDKYLAKQRTTKPQLPSFSGKKTLGYYKEIIRIAPNYDRIDEVIFLAGFRGKETGETRYVEFFKTLVKKFPDSKFVADSYMEIGDYHFNQREFEEAIFNYNEVLRLPNKLHNFALYKTSWCYYNQSKFRAAKKVMQRVVETSKNVPNEIQLRDEALKDLVLFYSDLGEYKEAEKYFVSIGEDKYARIVLEKLSDIYFDQARYNLAIATISRLIERYPEYELAPKYHSRLIDCYERLQNLVQSMKEMIRFLSEYAPESRWYILNQNPEHREYADTRSEVYGRFLANKYHEQSQKEAKTDPRASEKFALTAMGFYKKYLDRFSEHKNAYEMHMLFAELLFEYKKYDRSAEQYEQVVVGGRDKPHYKKALTGQIDSLNRVEVEQYKRIEPMAERKKALQEKLEMPRNTEKLIAANELYVKSFPKDPIAPEMLYQRARLFYNYNHFDKSLSAFSNVVRIYPASKAGDKSRHLILDIYNIKKDWVSLEKTAEEYLQVSHFATAQNKVILLDLIQGAIFKRAEDLEKQKEHYKAAQVYQSLTKRYPTSKYADKALYNASINYIEGDYAREAISSSESFLKEYPTSTLGPKLMLSLATYFDEKLDYRNAAKYFELLARTDPKSTIAPDALYNAGLYNENLLEFDRALLDYKKHLELYPNSKDAQDIQFSIANVYEKKKDYPNAAREFVKYNSTSTRVTSKNVEAYHKAALAYERMGQEAVANKAHVEAVRTYRRVGQGPEAGSYYAAKSLLKLAEDDLNRFKRIKLEMPEKRLMRSLEDKTALLEKLKDSYLEIINIGDPEIGVAALHQLGMIYKDYSLALFTAPVPTSLSPEEVDLYEQELQNRAAPIEALAIDSLEKALKKSFELEVYSPWTKKTYTELSIYKPKIYPRLEGTNELGEYKSDPYSVFEFNVGEKKQ